MKKIFLGILLGMAPFSYSQNTNISAKVINDKNQALDGNIILQDTNAHFLNSSYFEKGMVALNTELQGEAVVKICVLGYEDFQKRITLSGKEVDLNSIIMQTKIKEMNEVTVVAKRPIFERSADGTKVNVENTLLSKSANANELLGRVPTISIAGNKVQVFGRGEAMLMMNGREITFENFKSLPPSSIKSIEVITNPDARFDAKGKAVILISMQKHYSEGLSATLVNGITLGIIPSKPLGTYVVNAPNISINLRKNKWDFNTYYANELGANWSENNFITTANGLRKIGYYTENNHNVGVHYYRLGASYQLNEKASISVQYDGLSHFFKLDVLQNGDYYSSDSLVSAIRMTNNASTRLQNHSLNLNFNQKLSNKGSRLFIGAQINEFRNKLLDNITEQIGGTVYNRINNNSNVIRLYTAQLDYHLQQNKGSVDMGIKMSHVGNGGNILFLSKTGNEIDYTSDPAFANKTLYQEYVPAAYLLYKFEHKKLTGSVGLRWEHTIAESKSLIHYINYFTNSYSNVFPSVKTLYSINENWKWSTSYSYKINRPLFQDMDPFLWYLDSLTSIRGNALLKPEYLHQFETRLLFKSFTLKYAFTNSRRTITPVMMHNDASISADAIVFTKDNIHQRNLNTISLEVPFEKGNYSCYHTLAANIFQFKDSRAHYKALTSTPQLYFYTFHTYKIPKWFNAEFTSEVFSASSDGFTKRKPYYYFTIALSKSFLKSEALNVNLMWNDFARTAVWAGTFSANTYSNQYSQRFTSNYIRLTLTYSILSKTSFNFSNKNIGESEFNRIKK
ncbi:MAG: TonB-dependent receptor family protein [Bacteroidetes bacterium]|nr:TonB-dependent receptor family protein [Bacteroidota bacterium]